MAKATINLGDRVRFDPREPGMIRGFGVVVEVVHPADDDDTVYLVRPDVLVWPGLEGAEVDWPDVFAAWADELQLVN